MSQEATNPLKSNVYERRDYILNLVGGSSALTLSGANRGMTFSRTGAGAGTITFLDDFPGVFIGLTGQGFRASTPGDVDNYIAVVGDYDASAKTLDIVLSEGGTPTDLAANEYVTLQLTFSVQEA